MFSFLIEVLFSTQVTGDLSSCVVWQRALQELDMNKEEVHDVNQFTTIFQKIVITVLFPHFCRLVLLSFTPIVKSTSIGL